MKDFQILLIQKYMKRQYLCLKLTSSPFGIEFGDAKPQTTDYFSEITTLFSKSLPTSTSSESSNSSITTPDCYYPTCPSSSTLCNNKFNLSPNGPQKTTQKRKS